MTLVYHIINMHNRVHQHGAAKKKSKTQKPWVRLTTKIHAAVGALGNPVRLLLTPGQASECGQAEALLDGFTPG